MPFTDCNIAFSGFLSSEIFFQSLCDIEPVFRWVREICKLQLLMAWFVAYQVNTALFIVSGQQKRFDLLVVN